jgi:hypothetical protein
MKRHKLTTNQVLFVGRLVSVRLWPHGQ